MTTVSSTFSFWKEALSFDEAGRLYALEGLPYDTIVRLAPSSATAYYLGASQSLIDEGEATPDGWSDAGVISLDIPIGMSASPDGTLYLTQYTIDQGGPAYLNEVFRIDTSGTMSVFAGTGAAGSADGSALEAEFNRPSWLAVDALGGLVVADLNGLRRIDASGLVTTFAPGVLPEYGIAVDADGNVYASLQVNTLQRITPSGQISTIAGDGDAGDVDGPAATAQFNGVGGIAVDPAGNIFVGDNWHVREISVLGQVTTIAGDGQQCDTDGTGGPEGTAEIAPEFVAPSMAFSPDGDLYVATVGYGSGGNLVKIHFNP